jgi:hypothetical protein
VGFENPDTNCKDQEKSYALEEGKIFVVEVRKEKYRDNSNKEYLWGKETGKE